MNLDSSFKQRTAYVMQTDVLQPTDTVREAILFSAMCRLPQSMSNVGKHRFCEQIMSDMHLTDLAQNLVCGLSAEQKKRVNIAIELAADPEVLFLDGIHLAFLFFHSQFLSATEPTSGLDSAGARKVMKCIKRISTGEKSCSIICTIHQPSEEIFSFFDSLLLLAAGGSTVYFGPLSENKVMCSCVDFQFLLIATYCLYVARKR